MHIVGIGHHRQYSLLTVMGPGGQALVGDARRQYNGNLLFRPRETLSLEAQD
jgi:hypothetical protein